MYKHVHTRLVERGLRAVQGLPDNFNACTLPALLRRQGISTPSTSPLSARVSTLLVSAALSKGAGVRSSGAQHPAPRALVGGLNTIAQPADDTTPTGAPFDRTGLPLRHRRESPPAEASPGLVLTRAGASFQAQVGARLERGSCEPLNLGPTTPAQQTLPLESVLKKAWLAWARMRPHKLPRPGLMLRFLYNGVAWTGGSAALVHGRVAVFTCGHVSPDSFKPYRLPEGPPPASALSFARRHTSGLNRKAAESEAAEAIGRTVCPVA
ncbi:uncharacterized protein B0H18DRAFT_1124420 [Fomitopsis serialis]|uniref:uncharacterized protein n=1 Tax=Fomitopsis serialis TaxID=139415 RepID=UPI002007CAEC|nr:uncharacterized protein B0H18DRAFT_1124420 [Neoantrodia serialis]KAH9916132.1 hypothetical protein B0H18DRAFT_1124420 [Neoantrodia serialis]